MKRLLIITMTVLSLASACQGPGLEIEEPVVVLPEGAVVMQDMKFGMYYGNLGENGMGLFSLVLSDARCYQDDLNKPYLDSEGDMFVLQIRTPLLEAGAKMELPVGEYPVVYKDSINTVSAVSSYVKRQVGTTQSRWNLNSGYVNVEKVENGQMMITTRDLVIEKDGQTDSVDYVCLASFVIGDYMEMAPSLVAPTEDIVDMPFPDLECLYNGDLFGNKTGNFIIQMSTKGFVVDDNIMDIPGVCLIMNFFTKLYSGNAEPVLTEGTYNVSTMNAASLFKEGSLLPGILMDGTPFGTYFFQNTSESNGEVSPEFINSGYVDVKYNDETDTKAPVAKTRSCTITYDLKTSRRTISGVWKGDLLVTNLTPGSTESTLSTLSDDVVCDMSKITGGTIRKIETLHRSNVEEIWDYDIAEAWQLYLQPRDWTAEEKSIPWVDTENPLGADGIEGTEDDWMWDKDQNGKRDRLEAWCADGDFMIFEFILPLGSDGEIAPELGKEYTYTMQPNLSVDADNYEIYVSRMGRPEDEVFDPKYAEQFPGWAEGMNLTGYDWCNARRGFTWSEDGFRGNWYMHNKTGEHFILDGHAPAINGWVKVTRTAEETYDFSWEFIDDNPDAPNTITGSISDCKVKKQL